MSNHSTAKNHYDQHLGVLYSWMTGDFFKGTDEFKKFLIDNGITPKTTKVAIDLGAGHGIQSIPLAKQGFKVIAVDFNETLLSELKSNAQNLDITIITDDIRRVKQFAQKPELIVCCGDTLSHLNSKQEIETLIADITNLLDKNGRVVLSFRDYSTVLTGTNRFIPVKNDEARILTCILDYEDEHVTVTDLVYDKTDEGWRQKVSAYKKVRLLTNDVINSLLANGLTITFNQVVNRLTTIIAVRQ